MSAARTVSFEVNFSKPKPQPVAGSGRLPRVTKLLALAHRMDGLLQDGIAADYAHLARLGRVTRARITQIMNLLLLAPDLQEELLLWEPVVAGRDPFVLKQLQPIAAEPDWKRQRRLWNELLKRNLSAVSE
jgi:hypothetical protein